MAAPARRSLLLRVGNRQEQLSCLVLPTVMPNLIWGRIAVYVVPTGGSGSAVATRDSENAHVIQNILNKNCSNTPT